MNKIGSLLIFALGAAIGSGATYYYMRDKFESEQAEREEQLKAAYDAKYTVTKEEVTEEKEEPKVDINQSLKETMMANKRTITDYSNIIKKENYDKQEEKNVSMIDGEIIIDPEDFGEDPYDVVFATIYSDGYLVDSNDNIIDIEEQIGGEETFEHFGEGDDPDLLHVRNNLYEIDYEIDRDDRTYAEVSGKDPADIPSLD